jgi:hypothetical protein
MVGGRKPGGPEFSTSIISLEISPHGGAVRGRSQRLAGIFFDAALMPLGFELGHHGQEVNAPKG